MINRYKYFDDNELSTIKVSLISGLLAIAVFIIDLQIPLGVAGGVPYIIAILVSLWSPNPRLVIILAIICSLLTVLGFYLSPPGGELWKVISNRSLALLAIWVTTILALKWKCYKEEASLLEYKIEKEKEKIYLATIHGAQHITNNLLNELKLVELEIEKHPKFDKEVLLMFDNMLIEANALMKDLSTVDEIEDKTIRQSIYPKQNT